jgi:hypothetical protein
LPLWVSSLTERPESTSFGSLGGFATNFRLEVLPTLKFDWGMDFIFWFCRTHWFTARMDLVIFGVRYFMEELG